MITPSSWALGLFLPLLKEFLTRFSSYCLCIYLITLSLLSPSHPHWKYWRLKISKQFPPFNLYWRRKQNRLHLESRTPSWAGLWTLSYMPSICGYDIPTRKPDPQMEEPQGSYLDSPCLKEYPNYLCNQIHTFYYAYWGMTTGLLIIVYC